MNHDPAPPGAFGRPSDPDCHLSIDDGAEVELIVKGSRFLGQACRAETERAAMNRLDAIRRTYHDATHHCWALRMLVIPESRDPAPLERWSDDGEPSGSAGVPILGALKRGDLHEAIVVVTRWFGGTKLGTGGLTRAYSEAAREAIAAAPARVVWQLAPLLVDCGYEQLGAIEAALARLADSVHDVARSFAPDPRFVLHVPRGRRSSVASTLVDATSGRVRIREGPADPDSGMLDS